MSSLLASDEVSIDGSVLANQKEVKRQKYKVIQLRPEIGRDDPLNLSISLSGGKETNKDSPSNGE